ncbi:protein CHLOROPLAST IMPORT APPARATUS 2 [Sesamum angolense]|uniref:Protein CHLOROPLAST IMPORT APPARATUS 2 n=1 Tax=Sesamum angolense TaxID=2727404 RepID=A0AAE1WNU3_9LAMI|nr:protein CHLOROPLAST IMPORT APPARATUS 2 [Sesamum angolense]
MSSCLSGGGRAYRLESLDLEIIKSPSTSWISNSSSPSSTLSESSNCPLAISTRKPRTPRKRPNQTYNEAAALLSTAYPKIFPTKHLAKFTKPHNTKNPFSLEPSDLLMIPFPTIDNSEFLLRRPHFAKEFNLFEKPCLSPGEINSSSEVCDEYQDDIDAESILDEEIGEGIDSIIGKNEPVTDDMSSYNAMNNCCYGYPVGLGFEFGYGVRRELRAMRNVDEGDWWRFPSVNVADIAPTTSKMIPAEKKKKKNGGGLLLKLNYDSVLNAWSDKSSPFSGDAPGAESAAAGSDVQARLAQIDLFSENGGVREASVLRYKEKRRTRSSLRKSGLFIPLWANNHADRKGNNRDPSDSESSGESSASAIVFEIIHVFVIIFVLSSHSTLEGKLTKLHGDLMALECLSLMRSLYEQGNPKGIMIEDVDSAPEDQICCNLKYADFIC